MAQSRQTIEMVSVSITFRGPRQLTPYKLANDAALKAGAKHAKANKRPEWNLEDFDVAKREFHRVLDAILLAEAMEAREA